MVRGLSLLLRKCRLALVACVLRLHVFAYYLVLRELLLGNLLVLVLVAVKSAVVRIKAHAHVVQAYLGLVEDFVVR